MRMRLALAIVVYAFVNAGRVLLVKGINRCLWSCLSAGLYAFIGTADVDGHPTFEEHDLADKIELFLRCMLEARALVLHNRSMRERRMVKFVEVRDFNNVYVSELLAHGRVQSERTFGGALVKMSASECRERYGSATRRATE